MGPLQDSRTGQDLLPMLLQGKVLQWHLLDFSGFHTAVLWLGSSIVAAGATSLAQPCESLSVRAPGTRARLILRIPILQTCDLLGIVMQPDLPSSATRLVAQATFWHVQTGMHLPL